MYKSGGDYVVALNVGGSYYTALRSTLMKFSDSLLHEFGAKFSVEHYDQDGRIFLDRDGPTFRHVLNFLRTGHLTLPGDFRDYDMLEEEAVFYRIESLVRAVRLARLPPPATDEETEAKPAASPSGSILEVYHFEHSDSGDRRYRSDEKWSVCGTQRVLQSLPFVVKSDIQNQDGYQTVPVELGKKMELLDHLQSTGWQLMTSSFTHAIEASTYLPGEHYTKHKYVWIYDAKRAAAK